MKKVTLLVFILLVGVINLNARDMSGTFGIGMGWSEIGYESVVIRAPDQVSTKIGLSSNLVVEPMLGLDIEDDDGETTTTVSVAAVIDLILLSHAKTNIYLGGGVNFSTESPPAGDGNTEFGLIFDVGLEHFVSEYFSLDLSLQSQIKKSSRGDYSNTEIGIGNNSLNFGLVWYY
jgi:hypothetical protein